MSLTLAFLFSINCIKNISCTPHLLLLGRRVKNKKTKMGRIPCCEKDNVKRGQWTPEEDNKLSSYIAQHGTRNWRLIPKNAGLCSLSLSLSLSHKCIYKITNATSIFHIQGLQRCGKSCRLRWTNYLRPDLKHGQFSDAEEQTIVKLHSVVGNRYTTSCCSLPKLEYQYSFAN